MWEGLEEGISMFEESPMIQKLHEINFMKEFQQGFQEGFEEGLQEGIPEGEMLALRRMLVSVVRTRYPDLVELAQQQASRFNKPDALELLVQQVATAPNADITHWLLETEIAM
jgi:flagellar biosynthesis/type III secretory pathway protein FliH